MKDGSARHILTLGMLSRALPARTAGHLPAAQPTVQRAAAGLNYENPASRLIPNRPGCFSGYGGAMIPAELPGGARLQVKRNGTMPYEPLKPRVDRNSLQPGH
ncbi:hypothetical protein AAFF_G00322670 [Aldrovandia affinis]|uniref:Uncharacterized protein n=1 Tax=Aldrovandia affinis TaxID=143900 RepID=A0AAD7SPB4_9TELE|nr:hypothetical protein AAFF_G00322670 [Aldrovandia affinis]